MRSCPKVPHPQSTRPDHSKIGGRVYRLGKEALSVVKDVLGWVNCRCYSPLGKFPKGANQIIQIYCREIKRIVELYVE